MVLHQFPSFGQSIFDSWFAFGDSEQHSSFFLEFFGTQKMMFRGVIIGKQKEMGLKNGDLKNFLTYHTMIFPGCTSKSFGLRQTSYLLLFI